MIVIGLDVHKQSRVPHLSISERAGRRDTSQRCADLDGPGAFESRMKDVSGAGTERA